MSQFEQFSAEQKDKQPANQLPPIDLSGNAIPQAETRPVQYDAHQSKLSAAIPVENKSFEQVSREIQASQLDVKAAQLLDSGNVDAAARLFDDAFQSWGAVGVRQFAGRVSNLEKAGTGLDLKWAAANPEDGKGLISNFKVVESRSMVGAFLARQFDWADNTVENTTLHGVINRANESWDQQVQEKRTSDLAKDAERIQAMIRSGHKGLATGELMDYLNPGMHLSVMRSFEEAAGERKVSSYIKGYKGTEYGVKLMDELRKRMPNANLDEVLPERNWQDCRNGRSETIPCTEWVEPRVQIQKADIIEPQPAKSGKVVSDPFVIKK